MKTSGNPRWFFHDKQRLLDFSKNKGLYIMELVNHNAREEDEAWYVYDSNGEISIILNSTIVKKPSKSICALLHELGHHEDHMSREMVLRNAASEKLLDELLAGVHGFIIYKELELEIPQRYYIRENNSNIRTYVEEVKNKFLQEDATKIISVAFTYFNMYVDYYYKNRDNAVEIPESLLRFSTK